MISIIEIIIVFGARAVHDFMTQGFSFDFAAFPDRLGHLIYFIRMGPGAVYDDRGVNPVAVCQGDALNLSIGASNIDNLGIEHELSPFGLGSTHDVVG